MQVCTDFRATTRRARGNRQMRRRSHEPNEEMTDRYCYDPVGEFIGILEVMERHQSRWREIAAMFHGTLRREPQVAKLWSDFVRQGGLTEEEFKLFVEGR